MKNLFFIITAFAIGMVTTIGPAAKANNITPTTIVVEKAGTLSTLLSQESMDTITSLILKGEINGDDVQVLRYMTGRDKDGEVSNGMLSELDMSEVLLKNGGWYDVDGVSCGILEDELPSYMFHQCSGLSKITLPNRCKGIRENAFSNCNNLRDIKMPEGCAYISNYAFENCSRLKNIEIPRGVNTIDDRAFYSCTGLKNVKSPEGLMSIGTSAFEGSTVETINFPGSLRAIGEKAFYGCYCLKEVELPYAVRRIEPQTFANCEKLQSVILPAQLNVIEAWAFQNCDKLTELHIPPMVESIGNEAFTGCPNLKNLYVYIANANDISIDMNTFSCWNTATLHVPSFGYSLYYWNTQWSQFYRMENFDEEYKSFYTKNALVLNNETGKIDGTPDAIIYENGGLVVNEDVKQNIDNIEMKSDGEGNSATVIPEKETSIQAKHAQITVNVTGNQWHFFCFPFDIPLDSVQYQGDYVWRQYDGAARSRREGGWQNLPANETTLHAGRGYIFQGTNSGELKMAVDKPEFSANDVKTGLEVHPSEKAADASWNFVGNPYTSYYNIDSLAYEAPITVWTGNGYEAYRPGDDDYSFAPYTAFFVQTPEENQELGFGAGGRQTKEGAEQQVQEAKARRARRAANPARTLINLTIAHTDAEEDGYIDRTRIVFNE